MQLFNHQEETLDAMTSSDRGVILLPTGTGKTTIIAHGVARDILATQQPHAYVIFDPKIVLVDQVFREVRNILLNEKRDCHYFIVHSGGKGEDNLNEIKQLKQIAKENNIKLRSTATDTSPAEIRNEYQKAIAAGVPFVVFCTYKSAERIKQSKIPLRMVLCDEAHNLVSGSGDDAENAWIARELQSDKMFFFTATMRVTASGDSVGMNNERRFGKVIIQKSPREMVDAGIIVGTRLHIIEREIEAQHIGDDKMSDVLLAAAIVEAFKKHKEIVRKNSPTLGAKIIVRTRGSKDVKGLAARLRALTSIDESLKNVHILDISSEHKENHNGRKIGRKEFLRLMRTGLKESDDAIILQIRILTEGIDIQGITGILPMTGLDVTEFCQLAGRAMRLHQTDRVRLHSKPPSLTTQTSDLVNYTKPAAWIIVPRFTADDQDMFERMTALVESSQELGFNPEQDIVVSIKRVEQEDDIDSTPVDLGGEEEDLESDLSGVEFAKGLSSGIKYFHRVQSLINDRKMEEQRLEANRINKANMEQFNQEQRKLTREEKDARIRALLGTF